MLAAHSISSLSQQSSASVTRSFSPPSQPNSKPSEHQRHRDFTVMLTPRMLWSVVQQQQAVLAHHTINPFGIHGGKLFIARLFSQYRPRPSIAITRHIADYREDTRQQLCIGFHIPSVTARPSCQLTGRLTRAHATRLKPG